MKIRGNPTQFIDRVPTEKTIFRLLNRDKDKISDKYELIQQPLAWLLNKDGVPATNKTINNVKSIGIRVFICQHVLVDKLQFRKNDVVFTTHATTANKYEAIPFYAVNADPKLVSASKKYKFSFLGSVYTHHTRKQLVKLYPHCCFDSKVYWGIEKRNDKAFTNKYIKMLGETEFSLCPRGTGHGSIRMFEAMAMKSIPIVISDGYRFPLDKIIDWSKISISVKEKDIGNLNEIVKRYNYETMEAEMSKIYNKYFSNNVLHETVINVLSK